MIERHGSVVVVTSVRVVVPLAQLFALYVLVHGHESPGGGFQAGVVLAAAHIVGGLALGPESALRRLHEPTCLAVAAGGVLLYLLTGAVPMLAGAAFLDYAALPLPGPPATRRYLGILLVETGVMVAVAATLVLIFCRLAAGEDAG